MVQTAVFPMTTKADKAPSRAQPLKQNAKKQQC